MMTNPTPHPLWLDVSTILQCEVGSGAHGVATTGLDDRDEMGICLEPLDLAWTTNEPFEQYIYRTAEERTGVRNTPSSPGDLDLTVYSLRKWCRLALAGNPTVIMLLFASPLRYNVYGSRLRELAPAFASKLAIYRYWGYMRGQYDRLMDGKGPKNVNRQSLVDAHGFDTKYAGHTIRLGYQGLEYAEGGQITLPMPKTQRQRILDIRQGRVSQSEVMEECASLTAALDAAKQTSPLPDVPDYDTVNVWMRESYLSWWYADYAAAQFGRLKSRT